MKIHITFDEEVSINSRYIIKIVYTGKRKSGTYYLYNFSFKTSTFYLTKNIKGAGQISSTVVGDYAMMLKSGKFEMKLKK